MCASISEIFSVAFFPDIVGSNSGGGGGGSGDGET